MSAIIKTLKTTTNNVEQSVYPKTILEAVVDTETNETLDVILDNLNEKIDNIEPGGGGGEIPTDVQEQLDGKVSKSGDTMTGDLTVKANVNTPLLADNSGDTLMPTPTAGVIDKGDTSLTDSLPNYKSFMGGFNLNGTWYNLINVRHRNGVGDGNKYGMALYNKISGDSTDLLWRRQYGIDTWQDARTILDSGNYSIYTVPKTGGTMTGTLNIDSPNFPAIKLNRTGTTTNYTAIQFNNDNGMLGGLAMNTVSGDINVVDANGVGFPMLDKRNYNQYALPLTGGTVTGQVNVKGNVNVPRTADNTGDTLFPVPVAGAIQGSSSQYLSDILPSTKSFIGSIYANGKWYNVISSRHRNGASDGTKYGMALYSTLSSVSDLCWSQQTNTDTWGATKTILDSGNYSSYALPLTGGKVTGATQFTGGLTSTAESTILQQDYYVYGFDGGGGSTTGYIKFATIKTNNTYLGGIYKMTIHTRNCVGDLLIGFNGNSSEAGANLSYVRQTGNLPQIYIHKSATQTFDLYIYKMAYESCTVSRIDTSSYMKARTTLTWSNTYASAVPSDATPATKTNEWTTVLTSSGTSVVSLSLNQGSAYIISINTNQNMRYMLSVVPTSTSFDVATIGGSGSANCSVSGTTLTITFSGGSSSMTSTCKYIELK